MNFILKAFLAMALTITAMIVGILLFAFYRSIYSEKAILSRQVFELCKKDGGDRIYEKITLPEEYFDQGGFVKETRISSNIETDYWKIDISHIGDLYYDKFTSHDIHPGDYDHEPALTEYKTEIGRISDGKILATRIEYRRIGGDFINLGHTVTYCPESHDSLVNLVFRKAQSSQD